MDEEHKEDIERVPVGDLSSEPETGDLLESAAMEPYMSLAMAMMCGKDTGPAIEEIAALPLEKRYAWRVASALKWAFADFETLNVEADIRTLTPADRQRLVDELKNRPLQLCLFLSAIFGEKQMELILIGAIRNARVVAGQSEATD
jgi:hypothetical protein